MTSTSTASTSTSTTTVPLPPIVLHGTGDVNLDTGTIPNLAADGFAWAFAGMDGQFLDDDLTLINLAVVFWGLGNFVWPRNSTASADTAVAGSRWHPTAGSPGACSTPPSCRRATPRSMIPSNGPGSGFRGHRPGRSDG